MMMGTGLQQARMTPSFRISDKEFCTKQDSNPMPTKRTIMVAHAVLEPQILALKKQVLNSFNMGPIVGIQTRVNPLDLSMAMGKESMVEDSPKHNFIPA